MNRISLLFTQTLSTTQGANRPFCTSDEYVVKRGGVSREEGAEGGEVIGLSGVGRLQIHVVGGDLVFHQAL